MRPAQGGEVRRRDVDPSSARRLQAAIDSIDRSVPCAVGSPPRAVPHDHRHQRLIQSLVRETIAASERARRSALRSHVMRYGGPDIDSDAGAEWEPFVRSAAALREEQTDAIQKEVRSHAEDLSLPLIAVGAFRAVYDLPPGEVLKVSLGAEEDEHTRREAATWKWSSEGDASWLCPVRSAGRGWLVMALAAPYERPTPDGRVLKDFFRLSRDVNEDNVGLFCGRTVLIDYGV